MLMIVGVPCVHALSGVDFWFTGLKGVATTPLMLGVNDYLGCSVCTVRDQTVHPIGVLIAPSGTLMVLL